MKNIGATFPVPIEKCLLVHLNFTRSFLLATTGENEEVISGYRGHRDFEEQIRGFTRQLLSAPRQQLTRTVMTEKNW